MIHKEPKDRLELEQRIRDKGRDAKLFRNDGQREAHAWALKNLRSGKKRKTIDPAELR